MLANNHTPAGKTALALYRSNCGKHEEAVKLLTEAANQGDVEAMYNLALYYKSGQGVARNFSHAIMLLEKAASAPSRKPDASRNVGKYTQWRGILICRCSRSTEWTWKLLFRRNWC